MLRGDQRTGLGLVGQALPRRLLVAVALLALAGSLTEGLGLMLLVPMLGLIGAPAGLASDSKVARLWEQLGAAGLSASLSELLAAFVVLLALTAALVQLRIYGEEALELRVAGNLRQQILDRLLHAAGHGLLRAPRRGSYRCCWARWIG